MNLARNILIILLAFGITMPDALMHQVTHMPALVIHYQHHLTEHEPIGFLEFLSLHYGNSGHMQSDAHEHGDLPGSENHHQCQHAQVTPVLPACHGVCLNQPDPGIIKPEAFVSVHIPQSSGTSIWQPPKLAGV